MDLWIEDALREIAKGVRGLDAQSKALPGTSGDRVSEQGGLGLGIHLYFAGIGKVLQVSPPNFDPGWLEEVLTGARVMCARAGDQPTHVRYITQVQMAGGFGPDADGWPFRPIGDTVEAVARFDEYMSAMPQAGGMRPSWVQDPGSGIGIAMRVLLYTSGTGQVADVAPVDESTGQLDLLGGSGDPAERAVNKARCFIDGHGQPDHIRYAVKASIAGAFGPVTGIEVVQ